MASVVDPDGRPEDLVAHGAGRTARERRAGRSSPWAPVGILGATALAVGLARLYQAAVDAMPVAYLNALLTPVFGTLLGLVVREVLVRGRVRVAPLGVAGLILVVAAAWAASFHWAYVRQLHDGMPLAPADLRPEAAPDAGATSDALAELLTSADYRSRFTFGKYIDGHAALGWESEPSHRLRGWLVYLVWLLEAGVLGFVAWWTVARRWCAPLCETCGRGNAVPRA